MGRSALLLILGALGLIVQAVQGYVGGSENQTVIDAFEDYIVANHLEDHDYFVNGLGTEFAENFMRTAQFLYAVSGAGKEAANIIRLEVFTPQLIQCRLEGYLEFCRHPFSGNIGWNDVAPPYDVDFIITDEPVKSAVSTDIQNFPIIVLGVALIHSIPGVDELILDKQTAAKIFRGCVDGTPGCLSDSIIYWNDPAIKATNPPSVHPFLDAAGRIRVVAESTSSASTRSMKKALSQFEQSFAAQIGPDDTAFWNGTNNTLETGSHGVLRSVSFNPGSISYVKLNLVEEQPGVKIVHLLNGDGTPVAPSTESILAAFQEIGLNLTDHSYVGADLSGAFGRHAWPIVSLGYLAFASNFDEDVCLNERKAMLSFFEFLLDNQGPESKIFPAGISGIGTLMGKRVKELVREALLCAGEPVFQKPPQPPVIEVQADESLHEVMSLLAGSFTSLRAAEIDLKPVDSHISLKSKFACSSASDCQGSADGVMILADENLSTYILRDDVNDKRYDLFSMPYCAMATGFIMNLCRATDSECIFRYGDPLVMDIETVALILDLKIQRWNDSRIQALNPTKILSRQRIKVVSGPKVSSFHFDFVETVRRSYVPNFAFLGGGSGNSTYDQAWAEVALTPGSISFVPFNGTKFDNVQKISLISRQGSPVKPTALSIEACARDTYDPQSKLFFPSSSNEPECYPLVQVFNVFMSNVLKNKETAQFAKYVFTEAARGLTLDGLVHPAENDTQGEITVLSVANIGTLVDAEVEDRSLAEDIFLSFEQIQSTEGELILLIPHDLNLIPTSLTAFMYSLLAFELLCFFALGAWVIIHRNRKLVRNSSPVFMIQVLVGASIMACTVLPLAKQDSNLVARGMTLETLVIENPSLNRGCVAQPVLFSLGFFVTFSALFLKSWRLIRIFNNKRLRNLFLRDRQLLLYQLVVLVTVVVLNLIWALNDPLVWRRFPIFIDSESGLVVNSIGICYSRSGIYPALPLLIGVILVLALGNYLAYLGRRIPTEFNESKWTAMSMVVALEAFVLGLPILVLANSQPIPGFIVKAFCCLLVSGATVGLIFIPKVAMAYGWGVVEGDSNPWRFVKGDSGSHDRGDVSTKDKDSKNLPHKVVHPSLMSFAGSSKASIHGGSGNEAKVANFQSSNPAFGNELRVQTSIFSKNSNNRTPKGSPASKNNYNITSSEALNKILQDDPMRRRFRRYLQTLKMEENIRFWDSVLMFRTETDGHKRYVNARAIIQTFILDSGPLQVNLSSQVSKEIIDAYKDNDKPKLSALEFFGPATHELFEDLRQSDAFRLFLEKDTFSQEVLPGGAKSDPMDFANAAVTPAATPSTPNDIPAAVL